MTEAEKARAATIFDVARLAGVSHQTVSRVLNDLPNVRPATRDRVEAAIRQLRYVPSQAARALVTRRSRTLGLIMTGAPDFGPSATALHFNEAAREARYAVIMASLLETDAASLRSAAELLVRQNVEAVVLIAARRSAVDAVQGIELGVPLVAVASQGAAMTHRVSLDQFEGARRATSHLVELGHRDIRHIAGPGDSLDAAERIRGWRAVLGANGLVAREPLVGDWSPASGYRLGRELATDASCTAVFVANDQMALGVIHALADAGRAVPGDVSVVGFDDIPEAEHFAPPLTTVRQEFDLLGRDALATVLGLLGDEEAADPPLRAPALVERASTAAPRSATDPAGALVLPVASTKAPRGERDPAGGPSR
ncbi:LacI family DNA-binding transcriptional regulator [Agromyces intestinalis]|uniref:LacI family DNA-binding transcriptional regulator n=1 Tax=Agromyces intestinalis TaxID=2592652 RepID=A0A5C1YD33_9MICO|nr:LacI family DNA-binding transcriptional regulator [Agromyces intestinalis]QEO13936.1 LacI family DNA-binding transcriptional regulator [Agromyces intestinalis]